MSTYISISHGDRGEATNFRGEATNFCGAMSNFHGEAINFRGEATNFIVLEPITVRQCFLCPCRACSHGKREERQE